MADSIDTLQEDYIQKMATILVIALISLLLTPFVTRSISGPLSELTTAANMYAQRSDRTDVKWPSSKILEVNSLVSQFKKLIDAVNEKQIEVQDKQTQVIQASKLATLGEMATSVAHELNQPLNVIRMAAGNVLRKLEKGKADPAYLNGKLERIASQTERAAAIIDHMRMFGRKAEGADENLDPRNVITNTLDLIGEQLRLSQIEVVTEFPEKCPSIKGNMIQMEQVVLNLLTNSRDAIEDHDGEKKITLRVAKENGSVQITSEDTGGGIPEDALPRIFEPFYTTKETGKGTGLGLSVSYGIIRDMGGTIEAENVDAGAKFTITLPAVVNG